MASSPRNSASPPMKAKFQKLSLNTAAAKNPLAITKLQVRELIEAKKAVVRSDPEHGEQVFANMLTFFKAAAWPQALNAGIEAVAVVEKSGSGEDDEFHACALHNLASALHHLEHRDAARALYEDSIAELTRLPSNPVLKCLCMDQRERMLVYMRGRLTLLSSGGTPKPNTYWAADGTESMWTEEEIAEARAMAQALEKTQDTSVTLEALGTSYAVGTTPRNALW